MSNLKKYIQKLQSNNVSFEEQEKALQAIEQTIKEAKQKKEEAVNKNATLIVDAFKKIEDKLNQKYEELLATPAMVGAQGPQGPAGKNGKDGRDGRDGLPGKDGVDGKDGQDGKDGVGVVDARVDFDGSLVITLSDGNEIDAGKVVSEAIAKEYNAFMTRGEILPAQSGNGGKYLKTDGNILSWSSVEALPSQTGNNGKYLTTDGVTASWASLGTMATQNSNNVSITGGTIGGQDVVGFGQTVIFSKLNLMGY